MVFYLKRFANCLRALKRMEMMVRMQELFKLLMRETYWTSLVYYLREYIQSLPGYEKRSPAGMLAVRTNDHMSHLGFNVLACANRIFFDLFGGCILSSFLRG